MEDFGSGMSRMLFQSALTEVVFQVFTLALRKYADSGKTRTGREGVPSLPVTPLAPQRTTIKNARSPRAFFQEELGVTGEGRELSLPLF